MRPPRKTRYRPMVVRSSCSAARVGISERMECQQTPECFFVHANMWLTCGPYAQALFGLTSYVGNFSSATNSWAAASTTMASSITTAAAALGVCGSNTSDSLSAAATAVTTQALRGATRSLAAMEAHKRSVARCLSDLADRDLLKLRAATAAAAGVMSTAVFSNPLATTTAGVKVSCPKPVMSACINAKVA